MISVVAADRFVGGQTHDRALVVDHSDDLASCRWRSTPTTGDSNEFDVIESGASGGSKAAAEESDFTEIITAGQIRENHLAAGIIFRNLYETDAHEIEAVGRIALEGNRLARRKALQFDALFEMLNKIG